MVSPGATDKPLEAAQKSSVGLLPGVSTVSEMMRCMEYGLQDFKFFPAEASGGAAKIKALSAPSPMLSSARPAVSAWAM